VARSLFELVARAGGLVLDRESGDGRSGREIVCPAANNPKAIACGSSIAV
jgi:hypothetical protein